MGDDRRGRFGNMLNLGKPGEPSPMAREAVRRARGLNRFPIIESMSSDGDDVGGGAPLWTPKTSETGANKKPDDSRVPVHASGSLQVPSDSSFLTSSSDYEGGGAPLAVA